MVVVGLISLGWMFVCLAIFLAVLLFILRNSTHSMNYRKYLTNMYVAAKVRFFANEDNLNLDDEEKRFTEFISQSNKERITCLDNKIEAELMERVGRTKGVEVEKKK